MTLKRILSAVLVSIMLAGNALVSAPAFADESIRFEDVKADAWYYDAVADVYEAGLMKGKTDTKFDPTAPMSRAEFVTVLSRLAAINAANYGYADALDFTDTDHDAWYSDAAGWAVETGLSTGTSTTTFSPTREITRQEMAVLIVRFVKYLGETVPDNSKVEKFADAHKIASWATADIETMRKYGFIQGDQNGNFNPEGKADRASVATIAMRLLPYLTTTNVVENGKSDYVIVADEAAADAAERLQYQVEYTTGVKLDIVDKSSSKKTIVLKAVSDDKLGADGYEINADGETVTITGDTSEGIYKGAVRFILRATFDNTVKFTSAANDRYEFKYPIGKLTINGNDISKYKIVYPKNASELTMFGVNDLAEYIEKATGCRLEATTDKSEYSICIEEKTVKVDGAGCDYDSFTVKSQENHVILTGAAERGAMYACYELLEQIGWRFLMEDVDYIRPADSKDISQLNITENSVFFNRRISNGTFNWSEDMRRKLRDVEERNHTNNPHSFDELDGDFSSQFENQPCLTDPVVFELILKNVMALLEQKPNAKMISVSQNDNMNYCKCDNCTAAMAKYVDSEGDGGEAGLMIEFVNKIAEEVEKKYPNVLIHTFAYQYTTDAPTGIKPRDNVAVQLCSIDCCFNHPLGNESCGFNSGFEKDLKDWSSISNNLLIWNYTNNFGYHGTPYTDLTYDVLAGNVRLFADNNVKGIYQEGNGLWTNNGEFDRLRWYLLAKLAWDPYMSEEEYYTHMKDFMEGYYGKGWENVYDALILLHEKYDNSHLGIFDNPVSNWMHTKLSGSIDTLISLMENCKLKSESYREFCETDASQIQFDHIENDLRFDKLYNSGNEEMIRESQEMCFRLQKKMQKYGVRLSNSFGVPNFTEFTKSASYWKDLMPDS